MATKRRSGQGGGKDKSQETKKAKEGPTVGDECPGFELETDESTAEAKKTLALKVRLQGGPYHEGNTVLQLRLCGRAATRTRRANVSLSFSP